MEEIEGETEKRKLEGLKAIKQKSNKARGRMLFVANPKPQSKKDSHHYDDVRADG